MFNAAELSGLNGMSDEEIVGLADTSKEAEAVIIARYLRMILVKSEKYKNHYVESDDLAQEGLLGLLNAISKFRADRNVKFATFADVCVSNRMKSLLAKSGKTGRIDAQVEYIDDISERVDVFNSETPESIFLYKEYYNELFTKIDEILTDMEHRVFILCVGGLTYRDIAAKLSVTEKTVDNALQRARRKIKGIFREPEQE